jgi:hypothetical protein
MSKACIIPGKTGLLTINSITWANSKAAPVCMPTHRNQEIRKLTAQLLGALLFTGENNRNPATLKIGGTMEKKAFASQLVEAELQLNGQVINTGNVQPKPAGMKHSVA